jgi:hypothetical protein
MVDILVPAICHRATESESIVTFFSMDRGYLVRLILGGVIVPIVEKCNLMDER